MPAPKNKNLVRRTQDLFDGKLTLKSLQLRILQHLFDLRVAGKSDPTYEELANLLGRKKNTVRKAVRGLSKYDFVECIEHHHTFITIKLRPAGIAMIPKCSAKLEEIFAEHRKVRVVPAFRSPKQVKIINAIAAAADELKQPNKNLKDASNAMDIAERVDVSPPTVYDTPGVIVIDRRIALDPRHSPPPARQEKDLESLPDSPGKQNALKHPAFAELGYAVADEILACIGFVESSPNSTVTSDERFLRVFLPEFKKGLQARLNPKEAAGVAWCAYYAPAGVEGEPVELTSELQLSLAQAAGFLSTCIGFDGSCPNSLTVPSGVLRCKSCQSKLDKNRFHNPASRRVEEEKRQIETQNQKLRKERDSL